MEEAKPQQEQGHGKTGPGHPGVPIPQASQPPVSWASRPPRSVASAQGVSSCPAWALGCALGTVTLPRRRRTQVEPPPRGGRCALGFPAGGAGHVGGLQGEHGEASDHGLGSPLPTVWGPGLQGRERRLSPEPRGSALGPSPHSRGRSTIGHIPVAARPRPAAFPGQRLLSSQSQEDQAALNASRSSADCRVRGLATPRAASS